MAFLLSALVAQSGAGGEADRKPPFPLSVPEGFRVELVSNQVKGARFITIAPNGDILVAQLGSGRVIALRTGGDPGAAPVVVASGLERPNDLAFRGNDLYIAVWTGVVRIREYPGGSGRPEFLVSDLPRNRGHSNRALALDRDGGIFISSGSTCNVCDESDPRSATIMRYGAEGLGGRIYASGLRNASGLALDSGGRLWAVVNQRDNLVPDHNDLPPDELDLIAPGGDYGWPSTYPSGGKRFPNPEYPRASAAGFLPATFELQAHSAPLQAVFYQGNAFPDEYRGSLFIAYHGSWNRDRPTGYKVVNVRFKEGRPISVQDFATGWLGRNDRVLGRPVGLAVASDGSLYISDDTGYLFRVSYSPE